MLFSKRGDRVEAEAAALAVAGHPGVVELVGVTEGVLQTRMVEGRSLDELGPLSGDEVAGVAAAVATTLADLHELGVVHGGVDASHVLVGTGGRLLLCSLGRGGDPPDDVGALGRLVSDLLAANPSPRPGPVARRFRAGLRPWYRRALPARLGSMLAPPAAPALAALAAQAADPDPSRRPSARAFATAVHDRVPTARLPGLPSRPLLPLPPPSPASRRERRWWPRVRFTGAAVPVLAVLAFVAGLAGLAGVVALISWALMDHGREPATAAAVGGRRTPPATADDHPTGVEPVATRVWPAEPLHFSDGVLTMDGARFAIGRPDDVLAAGDWGCTGRRTIALLRPTSGEVFAFDGWAPPGQDLPARLLTTVAGGTAVRAVDNDGDGCHELEVQRSDQPPVHLEVAS